LNRAIRRKLAEAGEPPTTIGEWQERVVETLQESAKENGGQ